MTCTCPLLSRAYLCVSCFLVVLVFNFIALACIDSEAARIVCVNHISNGHLYVYGVPSSAPAAAVVRQQLLLCHDVGGSRREHCNLHT